MSKTRRLGRSPAKSIILLAATVFGAVALPQRTVAYQQQIDGAASRIGEAMNRAGRRAVAVVDFTDLQGNVTELGRFLAEQLSVALGSSGGTFEVIDRNHLRALIQEHRLSATGLIDAQTARKLGQIAGAETLVSGSVTPFSESVNLSIKLLDTNTAKILGGTTVDIPRTSTMNELLAKGVLAELLGEPASFKGAADARSLGAAASAKEPSGAKELVYGVEVTLRECRKTGTLARCEGTVKNISDRPLEFRFAEDPELIDNLGNRSVGGAGFRSVGSSSSVRSRSSGGWVPRVSTSGSDDPRAVELEPDLAVKLWIDDIEVATEATSLTARLSVSVEPPGSGGRVRVGGFSGSGAKGGRFVVVLRNIPLR